MTLENIHYTTYVKWTNKESFLEKILPDMMQKNNRFKRLF
ncbi:DUF1563 domain-containing protein [Candidatus Nitrosotalea okcheonensis]